MDELPQLAKMFAALALVIGMMGGLAYLLKKLGLSNMASIKSSDKRRLHLVESLPLDTRRRLVIIRRDNQEHLVILGANSETVVEKNIQQPISPVDSSSNSTANT